MTASNCEISAYVRRLCFHWLVEAMTKQRYLRNRCLSANSVIISTLRLACQIRGPDVRRRVIVIKLGHLTLGT